MNISNTSNPTSFHRRPVQALTALYCLAHRETLLEHETDRDRDVSWSPKAWDGSAPRRSRGGRATSPSRTRSDSLECAVVCRYLTTRRLHQTVIPGNHENKRKEGKTSSPRPAR